MLIKNDNRSKYFVFVPFCSLAQAFHAKGLVKYEWSAVIKPLYTILFERDVNIIQMPCPESTFKTIEKNLVREPKSYDEYNNEEFRYHCKKLAYEVYSQIVAINKNGYSVVLIIGIQFSPSCAVDLQYTNKGNQKLKGVFFNELSNILLENKINILMIGINRKGIKPSLEKINRVLLNLSEQNLFR